MKVGGGQVTPSQAEAQRWIQKEAKGPCEREWATTLGNEAVVLCHTWGLSCSLKSRRFSQLACSVEVFQPIPAYHVRAE